MIEQLQWRGYTDGSIFDNNGALLLRTRETAQVHELFDYLWHQDSGRSTRTMYYLYILAGGASDRALITDVLSSYRP